MANSPEEEKHKSFTRAEWLTITNLVLTFVTGVILAIVFHVRTQNFQIKLQERDAAIKESLLDLQKQQEFAKLIITNDASVFAYSNSGPSTASNLRIVLCLDNVRDDWKNTVKDIQFFTVVLKNASVQYKSEDVEDVCVTSRGHVIPGKLVTIAALPSQETVTLTLLPTSELTTNEIEFEGIANVLVQAGRDQDLLRRSAPALFNDYLIYQFAIADFSTNASCDNCRVENHQGRISVPSPYTITISSSQGISEDDNGVKERITFSFTYQPPNDLAKSSRNNTLYLIPANTGFPYFQEVDKNTFDSSKP